MRVEANVSVAKDGAKELGTKVELKNINSFKAVASAIGYEVKRQINVLDGGGKVVQETRGWDDKKSETFSQRLKEEANDYRYMPEPDLPPVDFDVSEGIDLEKIRISVPELPADKRQRFVKEFGMRGDQVEVLVSNMRLSEYFEEVYSELSTMERVTEKSTQLLVNYLTSDLMGLLNEKRTAIEGLKIKAEDMAELVALIEDGEVSSRVAKDILRAMFETGVDPHSFIKDKSLGRIEDDSEVIEAVKKTISENKKAVEDYKNGKGTAVKFLIGQAMGKLRGRGNPELLEKLFLEYLAK